MRYTDPLEVEQNANSPGNIKMHVYDKIMHCTSTENSYKL